MLLVDLFESRTDFQFLGRRVRLNYRFNGVHWVYEQPKVYSRKTPCHKPLPESVAFVVLMVSLNVPTVLEEIVSGKHGSIGAHFSEDRDAVPFVKASPAFFSYYLCNVLSIIGKLLSVHLRPYSNKVERNSNKASTKGS